MAEAKTFTAPNSDDCEVTIPAKRKLPIRRLYRQRAHCNPWSDHSLDHPIKPSDVDWDAIFERNENSSQKEFTVRFADIGCGYGGLLMKLGSEFPDVHSVGIEIRLKVSDFVQEKIRALRDQHPGQYENVACIRSNAMKFLPNYFNKHQLQKLFFLYPDPHFKKMKHKWRIISRNLLAVYAYLLCEDGLLYSATDVPELAAWIINCLKSHPLFKMKCIVRMRTAYVDDSQRETDPDSGLEVLPMEDFPEAVKNLEDFKILANEDNVIRLLAYGCTEEAQKAAREQRGTSIIVFERIIV